MHRFNKEYEEFRPYPDALAVHIAPTGFAGHSSGYRIFWVNKMWTSQPIGVHVPCPSISLDPDQSLDDIVNCIESFEAADHPMGGTIGLFEHGVRLRMFRYLVSHRRDLLSHRAAKPKKWTERHRLRVEKYPEDEAARRALSNLAAPLAQFKTGRSA